MDRLADYIKWMGDFPVSATGLLDADALVFCALSYIDWSPVFSLDGTHRVKDGLEIVENGQLRVMSVGFNDGYDEILTLAAKSRRYGELWLTDYTDLYRNDPPIQFSAICFHDDTDISFLAYRGTDDSLAGWKEDFMISFTCTEAQKAALSYAEKCISKYDRRWYIGGHSKGGNLVLYTGCMLGNQNLMKVVHLFLLDGPGLCPEVLDVKLLERIDSRTTRIIPAYSVVGKLFEPQITDTRIVRSSSLGLLQHILISWEIDHGKLALVEKNHPESIMIQEVFEAWVKDLSQEDRILMIDELFDALAAGGAKTLGEIQSGGWNGIEAIFAELNKSSDKVRHMFSDLAHHALRIRMEDLHEKLTLEKIKKRLTRKNVQQETE